MTVSVRLFSRAMTGTPLPLPADIKLSANSYSHKSFGGPDKAALSVSGSTDSLAQAFTWLRCPVEITSQPRQDKVWWGYVNEVHLQVGQIEMVLTLDSMANSVSVIYARVQTAHDTIGARALTATQTDADSIAEYGTKSMRLSLDNSTDAQALQLAVTTLSAKKYPQTIGPALGVSAQAPVSVTLLCNGWWETLRWKFFSMAVLVESTPIPSPFTFSYGIAGTGLAQSFQFATAGTTMCIDSVEVYIVAFTFDYTCTIEADSAGVPSGTPLATSAVVHAPGDGLNGIPTIFQFPSTAPLCVTGASLYWIVIRGPNYGSAGSDMNGKVKNGNIYPRGACLNRSGGAWTTHGTDDLYFAINGTLDNANQIVSMAAIAQFVTSARLDNFTGSNVYTSAYRNGDHTILQEIEDLLNVGNNSGQRMLATITPERQLAVRLEPLPTSAPTYYLDRYMELYNANLVRVNRETCPAGVWIGLKDVIPVSASFSKLTVPSPFFAESGSYNIASGRYQPAPRALGNIYSVGIK